MVRVNRPLLITIIINVTNIKKLQDIQGHVSYFFSGTQHVKCMVTLMGDNICESVSIYYIRV